MSIVDKYLNQVRTTALSGSVVDRILNPRKTNLDLSTSAGLYDLALSQGGQIASEARQIMEPEQTFFGRVGQFGKQLFSKVIRTLNVGASAVEGILDPEHTIKEAINEGLLPSDYLFRNVQDPQSGIRKAGLFIGKLATDVLLDPLTYVTFGAGASIFGVRATTKVGGKALTMAGQDFLQKGLQMGLKGGLTEDFVKQSMAKMMETSPALAKKFIDQGGIKYFGKTILSGQRILAMKEVVPGMKKIDNVLAPIRNTLGSLFSRDIDPVYGKLPQEFIDFRSKMFDLGRVKSANAIDKVIDMARANKITAAEADIVSNAIEMGTKLADPRLENFSTLIKQQLGIVRKQEIQRGILKDYPRILNGKIKEITNLISDARVEKSTKILEEKINNFLSKAVEEQRGLIQSMGIKIEKNLNKVLEFGDEITTDLSELLPSSIKIIDNKDAVSQLSSLVKKLEKTNSQLGQKLERTSGLWENYVPHTLVDDPKILSNFKPGITPATTPFAKRRTIEGAIENINADFGKEFFDTNIVRSTAKRMVSSERAITAYDFFRETAQGFGKLAKEAPSNYVEVGVKMLDDAGLKFHPAIARQLKAFDKAIITDQATNSLLKTFDKLQNFWKASVTSIFPSFHGRNSISNVFLNYLDIGLNAINPTRHAVSIELLSMNNEVEKLTRIAYGIGKTAENAKTQLDDLFKKVILTDKMGNKWTFGELRSLIKNNRVAFGSEFVGLMDVAEEVSEKLAQVETKTSVKVGQVAKKILPISSKFAPFKVGRKIGNWIEEEARLVNFVSNLQKTGDPLVAAQRAKQFLFDYQNLSPFEKTFMKRLVPFYTFTRKNLELQARALIEVPGRIAAEVKVLTTLGDVISGNIQLTDEENKLIPDWLKQGISILAGKNGEKLTILGSMQTPFEQPFQMMQFNQLFGSVSPILRVPLEQATGYNFFYEKQLSDVNNAAGYKNAPEAIKKFIGFYEINGTRKDGTSFIWYVSLNPERMNLLNNLPPFARVLSTLKQITNTDLATGYRLIQNLTGIRPYSIDLEKQAVTIERENKEKLSTLLQKSGVIANFNIKYIPKNK